MLFIFLLYILPKKSPINHQNACALLNRFLLFFSGKWALSKSVTLKIKEERRTI